jgi:Domain of unknown function (DUF4178)
MELLVLGLVATIGFASYALWSRAQAAPEDRSLEERNTSDLRVGDVVQHLGTDFVVEGSLTLAEEDAAAGAGPRLYRLADGSRERYLYAAPAGELLLLDETALLDPTLSDALEHERQHFRVRELVRATALRHGSVGARRVGGRVVVRLYAAGAAARLLVLEWADHLDAFLGERISPTLIEVLPGK